MVHSSEMHTHHSRRLSIIALTALGVLLPAATVLAATTLLVNEEAFETIDDGDGSTNVELRFGNAFNARIIYDISNGRFIFTKSVRVQGNITATGSITANGTLSGASLHISGPATVRGTLSASGAIRTDGDLTINDDASAGDATLTFGNATNNQTLKYLDTAQKFKFSKGVSVNGNLSGSSLTVDGTVNLGGLNYTFPTSRGAAGTRLTEDGAGNLTWTATSTGNGSGGILSLHPEYPNAVYFASGASLVGQLAYSHDTTNDENYYRWTSSQAGIQNYWIAVRVRLPDNFSSWDAYKSLEFRYRTASASTAVNVLRVEMLDTTGASVTLSGHTALASTSWATANITGPASSGTFTPRGYVTVLIKLATTSSGSADAGYLNFNWETTTP